MHTAAALGIQLPCGLATLSLFADDALAASLPVVDGAIATPTGPGLGLG